MRQVGTATATRTKSCAYRLKKFLVMTAFHTVKREWAELRKPMDDGGTNNNELSHGYRFFSGRDRRAGMEGITGLARRRQPLSVLRFSARAARVRLGQRRHRLAAAIPGLVAGRHAGRRAAAVPQVALVWRIQNLMRPKLR